ncbi:DUF3780 domain-containing protein [Geminocystis sp. CENA526]|uniref:DUF3780 domain-containing protein n=1 Tax=Geminocystis sp. CENA526 TaxID=1355871 RepID=UPI003D6F1895
MKQNLKTLGFGFIPHQSEHHFLVNIPRNKKDNITISEHLIWDENTARKELSLALGQEDHKLRVILSRLKWDAISPEVQVYFNQRLRENQLKSSQWKMGENYLSRLLGKELVLLCWSIEDADPNLIPVAIKNWLGLKPEERWWLFTMTNAATGHAITGRNKGWRKAIRYALTENPISGYIPQIESIEMPLFNL